MTRDMFDNLWGLENGYVDCTPKQYSEWVLQHGVPIIVRGEVRDLEYKKIAPGVIRVSKVSLTPKADPKDDLIAKLRAEISELRQQGRTTTGGKR